MTTVTSRSAKGVPPVRATRWLTLVVLCVSILMVNLDNTVLNVALPTLVRDLGATSTQLQWVVDIYALVFAGLLLVAGSIADRVGRKKTFVAGLVAFAAGSAWAAFSGSIEVLIAARASMGIGAAMMMPSTLSILTDVFTDADQRQRAIGIWAGTSGVGFALGPIVGGSLLAHFWWGSVFLINVPIAILGVCCAVPLVPDSKNPLAKRPDLAGATLSIAGLGLVLWTLIEAPVRGWSSALVVCSGVAGVAVIAGFVVWEHVSGHPMLNVQYFRIRGYWSAIASVGLVMFGLIGGLFVLTQVLQFDLGYSPLQAGVRMLPTAAALVIVSPLSAVLVRRVGTRATVGCGLLLVATGLWWLSSSAASWTFSDFLAGMVVIGVGAALVMPPATASVMAALPRAHLAVGSATNGVSIQVGGALGVAVVGSLLTTRYQDHLRHALAPTGLPQALQQQMLSSVGEAVGAAAKIGGTAGERLATLARASFLSGTDLGVRAAAAVALASFVVAVLALPRRH